MQGVSVRFRLGALNSGRGRVWLIPPVSGIGARWFKSSRPDYLLRWVLCWYGKATVNRRDAGSIPASAAERKGKPTGDGSCLESSRAPSAPCEFDSHSFRFCVLGRAAEAPGFQPGEAGSTPAGHSFVRIDIPGSTLLVVLPGFEPGVRRFDSYPRNWQHNNAGSSNGRTGRSRAL